MDTTKKPSEHKITALDVWNNRLIKELEQNLVTNVNSHVTCIPRGVILRRSKATIEAALRFEAFKHQTIYEQLAQMRSQSKATCDDLNKKRSASPWYRFRNNRRLEGLFKDAYINHQSFDVMVRIFLNTQPPAKVEEKKKDPLPVGDGSQLLGTVQKPVTI